MSETDDVGRDKDSNDADFNESDKAPDVKRIAGPNQSARRGALASVAWLALFLSLASVAALGYLYLERFRTDESANRLGNALSDLERQIGQRVDANQSRMNELDARLTKAEDNARRGAAELDRQQDEIDRIGETGERLASVMPRLANIERSLASLKGVSADVQNTYLLAEAEHFLQIANAQLQLAGNPYLARLALEQADDRLLHLGDPALTEVRRAVANEVAALDIMEKPDVAGLTLTLGSLAQVAESLPLRQEKDATRSDALAEQNGMQRAWAALKSAVTGLVRYTPPGDADAPLLAPDAEPLIRSNLELQLQAARLALLRGEQEVFEQSLDDAGAWLNHYFDTSQESVASAQQTLADIRAAYQRAAPPDISASLRLLRQYRELMDER